MPSSPVLTHAKAMEDAAEHRTWNGRTRLTAATIGLAAALTNFDVTSVVVVLPVSRNST